MSLLQNFHFWLLLSLITAIALFYRKIALYTNTFLVQKIETIKNDLIEGEQVLQEASLLLSERKKDLSDQATSNKIIIKKAETAVDSYYEKSIAQLNTQIKTAKNSYKNYLDLKYQEQVATLDNVIIANSIELVKSSIITSLNEKQHHDLIDKSINDIDILIRKQS